MHAHTLSLVPPPRGWRLVFAAALTALSLTACGGGGDSSNASGTPPSQDEAGAGPAQPAVTPQMRCAP